MATLTGANSVLTLTVDGLFDSPVTIHGYAVDDEFKSEAVSQAETLMGVDGKLSAGFVYNPYKMTIMLQADSDSIQFFETIRQTQAAQVDVFEINGTIQLPSVNSQFTLNTGFMTNAHPFPDVKKILQPMAYELTFESITSSPTA